mgnify:CR=1 FL=1
MPSADRVWITSRPFISGNRVTARVFQSRLTKLGAEVALAGSGESVTFGELERAANQVSQRFADREAMAYLRHALELLEALPDSDERARRELELRIRRALERLGPAFIKAGQLAATRRDLVAPALVAELEKLLGSALRDKGSWQGIRSDYAW